LQNALVVGAGVAGLTFAERLASSGVGVLVLERESDPGGLSRTFVTDDGFAFDIGPHRFHTSDAAVQAYLLDLLGSRITCIPRSSCVYLAGRYMSWPLSLEGVLRLPPWILVPSFLDLFAHRLRDTDSFADSIISRYGRNLYRQFFRDYTAKFTGMDAELLHRDWASAGVDRAVIDKRVKADSLFALLRGLLLPKPVSTNFIYPSEGGISTFASSLVSRIRERGGQVRLSCEVSGLLIDGNRAMGVRLADGTEIESPRVIWTGPVSILAPECGLSFVSTVLYNVGLRRQTKNSYQWCYFGEKRLAFSRLTIPRNFNPGMVPPGADSLTAEVTCREGDEVWNEPSLLNSRILEDLERVGAAQPRDVLFIHSARVRNTYPLYTLDYPTRLRCVNTPENVTLLGRCGTFWYNNMDHSIAQALAKASGGDIPRDFWLPRP
jgi:protoporphyrinogen oxidase